MECRLLESALSHTLIFMKRAGAGGYGVHLFEGNPALC